MNLLKLAKKLNVTQLVNNKAINSIQLLHLGNRFAEAIKREWLKTGCKDLKHISYFPDKYTEHMQNDNYNSTLFKSKFFQEKLLHMRLNNENFPFIMKFENNKADNITDSFKMPPFDDFLPSNILLSTYYFYNESSIVEKFYNIQRERKIWWMKLSTKPSRYTLTEFKIIKENNLEMKNVEITANFDFGDITLEKIQMIPSQALNVKNVEKNIIEDESIRKTKSPAAIKSEISLNAAILSLLYDASKNSNDSKLSLHRSITPYQCGVLSFSANAENDDNFKNLTLHLQNVITKGGVSVFETVKSHKNSIDELENEYILFDSMGVPYSITITQSSLKNGIVKLRNRDTTLTESIHITDMPYLIKIFKT